MCSSCLSLQSSETEVCAVKPSLEFLCLDLCFSLLLVLLTCPVPCYIFIYSVCARVWTHVCHGACVEVRG